MNTTTKTLFAVMALFSCVIVAQASDHNHDRTAHAPNEENHLHGPEVEVSVCA